MRPIIPHEYSRDPGTPEDAIEIIAVLGRYTLWQSPDGQVMGLDDEEGHEPAGFYAVRPEYIPGMQTCGCPQRPGEVVLRWQDGQRLCIACSERRIVALEAPEEA